MNSLGTQRSSSRLQPGSLSLSLSVHLHVLDSVKLIISCSLFSNMSNWLFALQSETAWGGLKGGQVMAQPKPVYARIEMEIEGGVGSEAAKKVVKKEKVPQAQGAAQT